MVKGMDTGYPTAELSNINMATSVYKITTNRIIYG